MLASSQGKGEPVLTLSNVLQIDFIHSAHALGQRYEKDVEDEKKRWADVLSQELPSIIF